MGVSIRIKCLMPRTSNFTMSYNVLSSDDDFDFEVKKTKRPKISSVDWLNFSSDEETYLRRDSSGELIIEPGQSAGSSRSSASIAPSKGKSASAASDVDVSIYDNCYTYTHIHIQTHTQKKYIYIHE